MRLTTSNHGKHVLLVPLQDGKEVIAQGHVQPGAPLQVPESGVVHHLHLIPGLHLGSDSKN